MMLRLLLWSHDCLVFQMFVALVELVLSTTGIHLEHLRLVASVGAARHYLCFVVALYLDRNGSCL